MKIEELNAFLQSFQDDFVCVINEKESCVDPNTYIIRAGNIEDVLSAKKFIKLFSSASNTSYILNFELKDPTK